MVLPVSCRWVPAGAWNVARRNVELLRVLRAVVPSFAHGMSADELKVKQLTGGMTNTVLRCSRPDAGNTGAKDVLLRIDGRGTDCLFDRSTGVVAQRVVGALGLGPCILGEFKNGRVEQFLLASTLTSANLRETNISKSIASTLARTHVESTLAMAKPDSQPLMDRIKSWYYLATTSCYSQPLMGSQILDSQPRGRCPRTGINIHNLGFALAEVEAQLKAVNSPLVFAHCDLQHGNIMMKNPDKIFLIDYEYALPQCPRGFDLANHFCEWGYDYDKMADTHIQQVEHLPIKSQKESFCESYLIAQDGRFGWRPTRAEVLNLVAEADAYTPVANLHWGLWGLVQAARNDCNVFDYGAYGAQRINRFLRHLENARPSRIVEREAFVGKRHSFIHH